jgi:hypothetical protein
LQANPVSKRTKKMNTKLLNDFFIEASKQADYTHLVLLNDSLYHFSSSVGYSS